MGSAADFQDAAERASDLLKLMANERRLMILCHLQDGPKSVGELEGLVGLRQAALSQHLAKLRNTGLVKTRREAQTIFYSLASHEVKAIIGCLHELFCQEVAR
jgi:DNA-binding transcriptional ArsR family regulator|tara:strand:+ start:10128 stop:10436 length:309 start_codon:yes stop_codon:yes gene_type:complete